MAAGTPGGPATPGCGEVGARGPRGGALGVLQRPRVRHAHGSFWVDFQDFGFFCMWLADIYFVGGFGSRGWVMPDDYAGAAVDPLADEASSLLHEFNTEQAATLLLLARVFGNVEAQQATVTALDRLGFHLRLTTPGRMQGGRVAFANPLRNASEARAGLADLAVQANAGLQALQSL